MLAYEERCFYCGILLEDPGINGECKSYTRTRDHIRPLSRGGTWDDGNLVLACFRCNKKKGSMNLEEYRTEVSTWADYRKVTFGLENGLFYSERQPDDEAFF